MSINYALIPAVGKIILTGIIFTVYDCNGNDNNKRNKDTRFYVENPSE